MFGDRFNCAMDVCNSGKSPSPAATQGVDSSISVDVVGCA